MLAREGVARGVWISGADMRRVVMLGCSWRASEVRFRCSDRPLVGRSSRRGLGTAVTAIHWLPESGSLN